MSTRSTSSSQSSHAYELFILVLTVLSLAIMAALLLPLSPATNQLLIMYDYLICAVFLFDFLANLRRASSKREYLIGRRGWLDLLGSVPTLGFFELTGLLRLARLSRLARITRLLRTQNRRELLHDVISHRSQYATFITVITAFVVLVLASMLVLQFESTARDANITSGGSALWWGVVTITTVGYGDTYPITLGGRLTALFVMFAGLGIIGSLASILSSLLISPPSPQEEGADEGLSPGVHALQQELMDRRNWQPCAACWRHLTIHPPADSQARCRRRREGTGSVCPGHGSRDPR